MAENIKIYDLDWEVKLNRYAIGGLYAIISIMAIGLRYGWYN